MCRFNLGHRWLTACRSYLAALRLFTVQHHPYVSKQLPALHSIVAVSSPARSSAVSAVHLFSTAAMAIAPSSPKLFPVQHKQEVVAKHSLSTLEGQHSACQADKDALQAQPLGHVLARIRFCRRLEVGRAAAKLDAPPAPMWFPGPHQCIKSQRC